MTNRHPNAMLHPRSVSRKSQVIHTTTRFVPALIASLAVPCALAACSKGGSTTQPGAAAQSASAASQAAAASVGDTAIGGNL